MSIAFVCYSEIKGIGATCKITTIYPINILLQLYKVYKKKHGFEKLRKRRSSQYPPFPVFHRFSMLLGIDVFFSGREIGKLLILL